MGDWENWLGRSSTSTAQLHAEPANRMAVTLDREPRYREGDTLPPAWHWLYFHDLVRASELGHDGHPRLGVVLPPVPLPRRMWAGGSFVFHAPLHLGATVTRTSTISAISPKEGRAGPMYFVTVAHHYAAEGEHCLVEEQTLVYRELSREPPPAPTAAPTRADVTQRYTLDSTALFRYSALTFNGHRIHYDADYARSVEGYPGLVVHGPLIATLLLDLYARQGRPLKHFSYKARSPLCLPGGLTVSARASGGGAALWASDDAGGLLMEAEASGE
jgi:3-methylfumaryl-CoA hydratase